MLLRDALDTRRLVLDVPTDALVRCDPDKLVQVLVNLLSNAIEATPAGGALGMRFTRREGGCELCVWDTGEGFSVDAAQLFAPWYSTKPRGTGLGLAITHRIVRAHEWDVTAARVDGRTEFRIAVRAGDLVEHSRDRAAE
jgi:signal transduction histidine kinase